MHRVSTWSGKSGKSRKVREFVRGSGKVREIRDFLEKVREENVYPCNFLTSTEKHLHIEMYVVELYTTISPMYNVIISI